MKLVEEKQKKNICELVLGKYFFDRTQSAQTLKQTKTHALKLKFCVFERHLKGKLKDKTYLIENIYQTTI